MSRRDHFDAGHGREEFRQFIPDFPTAQDAYDEEIHNAARRRIEEVGSRGPNAEGGYTFGRGAGGPLGPLDADLIEQTRTLAHGLSRQGFPVSLLGEHPRGFSIDTGIPDVQVTATINPSDHSLGVSVLHGEKFKTDDEGNYVHPEDWGTHDARIPITPDLPSALMDHLTNPDVRRHMFPPGTRPQQ